MLVKQTALLKTAAAFNETLERGKGRAGSKLGTWRQRWSLLIKVCISCGMSPCYSKRCKIQKSIYHTKSGNGGEKQNCMWESEEDNGMQRHALQKHIRDPMIFTTSKSFLSCLNIFQANPTALLFCYRKSSWLSCSSLEPWSSSPWHRAAGLSKRGECSQPCAHTEGQTESQPQLAALPNTPGVFPFQEWVIRNSHSKSDSEGKTVVRPMIDCSFHPISLAMAAFCEHLKIKEKVNHPIGLIQQRLLGNCSMWAGKELGEASLLHQPHVIFLSLVKNIWDAGYTMFFSWFFTGFRASSYVGDTTNGKSGR